MKGPTGNKLASTLLEQGFIKDEKEDKILNQCRNWAKSYVSIENCLAVLSDLQNNISYVYAGKFADIFGLHPSEFIIESAFEDDIFGKIHPDDLTERHVLELRYFQFQKKQPIQYRPNYNTHCRMRVLQNDGTFKFIIHKTFYLASSSNGSVWLSLCLYTPHIDLQKLDKAGIQGVILDNSTGNILPVESYTQYDKTLLGKRELEVLQWLSLGLSSKQIADKMHISVYTVYRHRQNILLKLNVANTAEAVRTLLVMGIFRNKSAI